MRLDFKKAQFKNLEKAHGTGADDDGIGFDDLVGGLGNGQKVFNSHVGNINEKRAGGQAAARLCLPTKRAEGVVLLFPGTARLR